MRVRPVLRAAVGLLVGASGWLPVQAVTPAWLIQLEHAVDDNPAEVFASAKAELATVGNEAGRRHAQTRMLAAAVELEQQDAVKPALPLAQAMVQAGGPAGAWCVAAAAEPVLLRRSGNSDASREAMDKAVAQARASGQDWCIARVALIQGRLLQAAGRQGEAAKALQEALSYFESHGENTQAAAALADLGWLANHAGPNSSRNTAIEKLQAALALLPQPVPRRLGSVVHHNLAGILLDAGDTQGARRHLEEAVRLTQSLGDKVDIAFLATLQARLELREKRPAAALEQASKAHRLFEQAGVEHMTHTTATMMAEMLIQQGRPAEALKTLDETDALRRKLQSPYHDAAHWRAALSANAHLGHLQAAVEAADAFAAAVEQREQLARQRAVADANAQFQVERREAENRRLREHQTTIASRQFWLGMSLLLTLALVTLLVGYVWRQRRERLRLRRLGEHNARSLEEERKRVARELHDELGQQLAALRMEVSVLRVHAAGKRPPHPHQLDALLLRVDSAMTGMRSLVSQLRPPALDGGLTAAIEWLATEFGKVSGVDIDVNIDPVVRGLSPDTATMIFRIAQESLNNVRRHAHARHVELCLRLESDGWVLTVADDGIGFEPANERAGYGLLGMEERARLLGGVLKIRSAPGEGATIELRVEAT